MRAVTIAVAAAGLMGVFGAGSALAEGAVDLKTVAEQEIREVDASGKEIIKRVPAAKVVPGDEVIYTITARSLSDQPVENIQIEDPIPEHTTYVLGSVQGENSFITFSVDGGRSFSLGDALTVVDTAGVSRPAKASDYTHVRWAFAEPLPPGGTRSVSFRARLK